MITTSMKRELSEEEKREVRESSRTREQYEIDALRSLGYLHRREESVDVVLDVLRQEDQYFTPIPSSYRYAPNTFLGRPVSSAAASKSVSPMRAITENSEYEERLASRSPQGAFRVPVERALPISYEAQCDLRHVTGERRRSSLHLTSGYAPLFTQSSRSRGRSSRQRSERSKEGLDTLADHSGGGGGLHDSDTDLHASNPPGYENGHLSFLHPPEHNPKKEVQERYEAKHALDIKSRTPAKKVRKNKNKKKRPTRKVSADFVPSCSMKGTCASEARAAAKDGRPHSPRKTNPTVAGKYK